jgi:hypothetical protein
MAGVRFIDVQARPTEFLDVTSLTLDEFQLLVPPFEAAFQAPMGSRGRRASLPCPTIAPCRRRKIGCFSF